MENKTDIVKGKKRNRVSHYIIVIVSVFVICGVYVYITE